MAHPDPKRRKEIARRAAHISWARTPIRAERLAAANTAREASYERDVDPDGVMSEEDRRKAARNDRTAFYLELSRLGVEARRRKRAEEDAA
ncbi:hypothetical protein CDO52_00300 [Nocardiopsis gilva YIM 90087]|uniref:Uncharacterized protein n=1 Tax=Nocardiopsis gilva YIM 90087 TaxID=1235441 RepID=A0A223RZY4_9ACTN|nr:hypothetical protein [Nocardiopsis gilva]ASU81386.1 hypothetical protein CDO52_00065 [Nocardiopsis gilva YIM 90087]ASU81424.1 hypothetical protein CDO52_00300 [Nocardiopsis gilva YIM 90087]